MINHVRTLLLNRDARDTNVEDFGYEVVPVEYGAARLPSVLQRVRRELFGSDPDNAGLNYRLREFMALLHAPDVLQYTLAADSRVTYDLTDTRLFRETYAPRVDWLGGALPISFVIEPGAMTTTTGHLYHEWLCLGTTAETYDEFAELPLNTVQLPPSWGGTISEPILLPGSRGISVRAGGTGTTLEDRVRITAIKRPRTQLAALPGLLHAVMSEETAYSLFYNTPAQYREWWERSDVLPLRLAGVLLALAERTDSIRRGG